MGRLLSSKAKVHLGENIALLQRMGNAVDIIEEEEENEARGLNVI
jgi:hypothetical protein